jgi:hypothetical protein
MRERRKRLEIDVMLGEHEALRDQSDASGDATCCVFADELKALRLDLVRVNAKFRAMQGTFGIHEREERELELRDLLDIVMEHV